jgi:CubicO group peptidase (beta-lactamase class C family)
MNIDRRRLMSGGGAAAIAALSSSHGAAQPASTVSYAPTPAELAAMADAATGFMRSYDVPGLGVAIVRHGVLVYDEAFGVADREAGERLTPAHRFRIASVSKPITSVATFTLIEQGRLRVDDRVFGHSGILGNDFGSLPAGSWIDQITVEHLLTHTSGGWTNDANDPMFQQPQLDHRSLIARTLESQPLTNQPGTAYAYSNFGYCVLGRVIEKVARRPYETFVLEAVLARAGVSGMEIAGNTLADRRPREVRYYGQGGENPFTMNVRRMDAHGGWLARPAALAVFASHVDGFSRSSILEPATIQTMTTASAANSGYAKGWQVNALNNWWHNGSLPGTISIMVRTHSQFCWAALINTRRPNSPIGLDLDNLVWKMARKVASWNA